jgi:hypothetical protein
MVIARPTPRALSAQTRRLGCLDCTHATSSAGSSDRADIDSASDVRAILTRRGWTGSTHAPTPFILDFVVTLTAAGHGHGSGGPLSTVWIPARRVERR